MTNLGMKELALNGFYRIVIKVFMLEFFVVAKKRRQRTRRQWQFDKNASQFTRLHGIQAIVHNLKLCNADFKIIFKITFTFHPGTGNPDASLGGKRLTSSTPAHDEEIGNPVSKRESFNFSYTKHQTDSDHSPVCHQLSRAGALKRSCAHSRVS